MLPLLLAGCSSLPSSINPVSWWHNLQGGKIGEERPPPPGADQPYPNLSTVPPKPPMPDRAEMANIANALIADRTNAQHIAAAAPIADPSVPSASPGLFGRGTASPPAPAPPPGTTTASATMPAAEATPPPPGPPANGGGTAPPPSRAPVGNVQSTPLAPPGATAQPPAAAAGPEPPLPNTPPPPPNLPGVAQATPPPAAAATPPAVPPPPAPTAVAAATPSAPPPSTQAAAAPPPAAAKPVPPPQPAAQTSANTVSVTFITGSAELSSSATDTLKQLAARRGNGIIAVTGYGDAATNDPNAQSGALTLGLSRAKAMATALTAAGVPATAVQVDAEAIGRGGTARLVQ